jgi:hypothetical protein
MASATLLDIAKLNGSDKVVGLIEENLSFAPELSVLPARTIKGTSYYTTTRTAYPGVGFRSANSGSTPTKSSFERKLVECFILSGTVQVDKAVGQAYEDGLEAYEMLEADGVMKQALINMGKQVWYGVSTDSLGFPGVKAVTPHLGTITLNSSGSDATVQTSAYFVKVGTKDVSMVYGNGATLDLSDFADQQLSVDSGTSYFPGRVASLTAWSGLQIGNINCVGRIYNIGQDSETGDTLTDSKIAQLLQKFPVGYVPDYIFMNRRSAGQLQRSRSVTIFSGPQSKATASIDAVAPWPDSSMGIPIIVTDSILSTDAVES